MLIGCFGLCVCDELCVVIRTNDEFSCGSDIFSVCVLCYLV